MTRIAEIRSEIAENWIPQIYRERVRSGRTRAAAMQIPRRENSAEILYTLLGIELKIGRRRIVCPDLATARYLRVFARIGCQAVALPYDITRISPLADLLEVGWQRTLLLVEKIAARNRISPARLRSSLIKTIREEIDAIGPGEYMPQFKQSTGQRNN